LEQQLQRTSNVPTPTSQISPIPISETPQELSPSVQSQSIPLPQVQQQSLPYLEDIQQTISKAKKDFMNEHQILFDCVICQDAPKSMAFIPCGHFCVCEKCSQEISHCPVCRSDCQTKIRIYH